MSALASWWASRMRREQWLIGVLLALLVLCFYIFAIAAPLMNAAERARQDYGRAISAAAQQQAKARQIIAVSSGLDAVSATTPQSFTQAAQSAGLAVQSAVTERGGSVRLVFENVDGAALTQWIASLPRAQGVSIERLQIQRSDQGRVSATVTVGGAR